MGGAQEDLMAMMKGALVGAALGALALGTVLFVAPIAAQDPGPAPSGPDRWRGSGGPAVTGEAGPRMPDPRGPRRDSRDSGPGTIAPGTDRDSGPSAGRRPIDPNDPDITGPRDESAACHERLAQLAQWRLERIQRLTRPTEEQRPAFEELKTASTKALDILRQACPAEQPLTPPARMATMEKWLEARLQVSKTVRPALEGFYRTLSDEQKIRWITGPRLEAWWRGDIWDDAQTWDRPNIRPPETRPSPEWPPRGAEERGRDRGPDWRGAWRDPPDTFSDERGRGGRDRSDGRYGFDRGDRGGERGAERYRYRDDDRGGWDDRWRDQDRGRWSDQRWREPRWRDDDVTGGFQDRR